MLECEDELLNAISLNTTNTVLIADKKVACKNNCLINIVSLATMCLVLLAIVSISCYYYYTIHYILVKKGILSVVLLMCKC